jgi:dTDP-4-dehydrorhamnose reductase
MLGKELAATGARQGFDVRVHDLPEFDITDAGHLKRAVDAADLIINCAAYTDVDGAESQSRLAHRVNGEAVGRLGELARDNGKWVLHFSTDFVFDGRLDRPYVETDTPNPISEYGKSKLAGERFLEAGGCRHCILRLEWMYGFHRGNFVTKLIRRAASGEPVSVVNDQIGAPTASSEVARVVWRIARERAEGIYHFAGAGYASRYDVAAFVVDCLSLPVALVPCRTTDYPALAARPLNSRFECGKIRALLDEPIAPWQEPLERYLRQL